MNVTLDLSLETAERLREKAAQGGQSLETYLSRLVEGAAVNGISAGTDQRSERDEDRPWRGLCVLPRPRRPLFVGGADVPSAVLRRRRTPNLNWLRTDQNNE